MVEIVKKANISCFIGSVNRMPLDLAVELVDSLKIHTTFSLGNQMMGVIRVSSKEMIETLRKVGIYINLKGKGLEESRSSV